MSQFIKNAYEWSVYYKKLLVRNLNIDNVLKILQLW